jgi:hypothetical protein
MVASHYLRKHTMAFLSRKPASSAASCYTTSGDATSPADGRVRTNRTSSDNDPRLKQPLLPADSIPAAPQVRLSLPCAPPGLAATKACQPGGLAFAACPMILVPFVRSAPATIRGREVKRGTWIGVVLIALLATRGGRRRRKAKGSWGVIRNGTGIYRTRL